MRGVGVETLGAETRGVDARGAGVETRGVETRGVEARGAEGVLTRGEDTRGVETRGALGVEALGDETLGLDARGAEGLGLRPPLWRWAQIGRAISRPSREVRMGRSVSFMIPRRAEGRAASKKDTEAPAVCGRAVSMVGHIRTSWRIIGAIGTLDTSRDPMSKPPRSHGHRPGLIGLCLRVFLRGLAAILPLALTGYLVYVSVVAGESLLRGAVLLVLPEEKYVPGMGLFLSACLVLLVGLLMYSFVVRFFYRRLVRLLERIPIVKSVYGMLVDVVRLVASPDERPFQKVVYVQLPGGMQQIGFLTRDGFDDQPELGPDLVAVYLPMSYQLGGFTVIVPRASLRDSSMSVEDALRFCVTAGVTAKDETEA
ncbi:MAG: DUF502 domain-containing protein [Planctomycetota bacterium]